MIFEKGEIVLTPFPYADLSQNKVRPALIISREEKLDKNLTIAFISSVIPEYVKQSQITLREDDKDFELTGLSRRSVIRCDKLATIDRSIILGKMGKLSDPLLEHVNLALRYYLQLA